MKVFMGYHCDNCNVDFDVDSRNLRDHADPACPVCGCDDKVKHIYGDVEDDEEDEE